MKKICFAASSGGHFEEIMMLESLMEQYDGFILTEETKYSISTHGKRLYRVQQINRKESLCIPKLIVNAFYSFGVFIKEKPDVIVTTGVLATIPMCLICKMFGKKLIFIESFANVDYGSRTGRFMYRFADRFYVQWKSMLKVYPDAVYVGSVF